ncbi:unnamed protein product [Owenia fusiformis]|uniref:Uncharacterized protein n=1 Tax=Owenia fusiformis TaxID=6347 RepID=A0A8J1XIR7_OWEFU|nr:unnamed protein product [Owenia fusiformis]
METSSNSLHCPICHFTCKTSTYTNLLRHLKTHLPWFFNKHLCLVCKTGFGHHKKRLEKHVEKHTSEEIVHALRTVDIIAKRTEYFDSSSPITNRSLISLLINEDYHAILNSKELQVQSTTKDTGSPNLRELDDLDTSILQRDKPNTNCSMQMSSSMSTPPASSYCDISETEGNDMDQVNMPQKTDFVASCAPNPPPATIDTSAKTITSIDLAALSAKIANLEQKLDAR